ncbi:dnaJ homolog subfamily C member 12 [Chiloscyllium punctatum]
MDGILNRSAQDAEDYYQLLGCDELSTTEQIVAEFKAKALACHPDKHPHNPKAVEQFQKLQQAKEILTNEERRSRYDQWYRSRIAIPFQQWEALSDTVKMSMHWAVRGKKEPMLEAPTVHSEGYAKTREQREPAEEEWTPVSKGNEEQADQDGAGTKEKIMTSDDPNCSESPTSPRFLNVNDYQNYFCWSADSPSELLRKFRNYEI